MKRVVAGLLLSVGIFGRYAAFAALPSFIASAVWSSDLIPDPDFIDAVDVDFLAASPDLFITDEEMVDTVMLEEEITAEEPTEVEPAEEELLIVRQPETEEQLTTPDKAVEDEVIDEAVEDEVGSDKAVKVEIDKGVIATQDEAEGAIQCVGSNP